MTIRDRATATLPRGPFSQGHSIGQQPPAKPAPVGSPRAGAGAKGSRLGAWSVVRSLRFRLTAVPLDSQPPRMHSAITIGEFCRLSVRPTVG
jgi:hypothetical protein